MSWVGNNEGCRSPSYRVEYLLTNEEQCEPKTSTDRVTHGTIAETSSTINGLLSYSTYQVFITPRADGVDGTRVMSSDMMTSEASKYHILRHLCGFI